MYLRWVKGELREVKIGRDFAGIVAWTTHMILAPYDHIIVQLVAEIRLSKNANSHETRHHSAYAKQVLDLFVDEITKFKGNPSQFYSTVLTPLLMRWLKGLHDASSKLVLAVIGRGAEKATMEQATAFYLTLNPTNPKHIRLYRRQLLNLPIACWYLATILKLVPTHWGQGVKYPAGTLRRHGVHRHKVITMCPAIKN